MSFIVSKIVGALIQPIQLVCLTLAIGLVLGWLGWARLGRWLVLLAAFVLLSIVWLPVGRLIALPLEQRFPMLTSLPDKVDGIIVLGGFANPELTARFGQATLGNATERFVEGAVLARRYPQARLLHTGGSGFLLPTTPLAEADISHSLMVSLGFDEPRMLYENKSRNTWENALYSKELVQPQPGETWLLVTSAIHMPRSVGIFRQVGWQVIPYPVDYRAVFGWNDFRRLVDELELLHSAVQEWVGLVAYWWLGRTTALFPGP